MTIPKNHSSDSDYESLIGNPIPGGTSRSVYHVVGHSNWVIKVNEQCGANKNEAGYYFDALNHSRSDVLACVGEIKSISASGKYLVMEYLPDIVSPNEVIVDVPTDIGDLKRSNFGENNGSIKLRDYAMKKDGVPTGGVGKYKIESIASGNDLKNLGNELDAIFNSSDLDI